MPTYTKTEANEIRDNSRTGQPARFQDRREQSQPDHHDDTSGNGSGPEQNRDENNPVDPAKRRRTLTALVVAGAVLLVERHGIEVVAGALHDVRRRGLSRQAAPGQ